MRRGFLGWLSKPWVILSFLMATLMLGGSFSYIINRIDGPLLDMIVSGDKAIGRLNQMDGDQRQIHFWATVTLDMLYPLAYGGLFTGLLCRFGWRSRWLLILSPMTGVLADFAENTVQAMALGGYAAEILVAKDIVTPLKYGALLLSFGLTALLGLIAALTNATGKKTET